MLKILAFMYVYFEINLKGESFDFRQENIYYFHNPLVLKHLKNYVSLNLLVYNVFIFSLSKLKLSNYALL
jgi:hypothetical protein